MAQPAERVGFGTGALIERMIEIRDERRRLKQRDSELTQAASDLEKLLVDQLDAQGVTKASTSAGTATLTETVLPRVEDWQAFHAHLKETGALHLLHRRVSSTAFRELHEVGASVPGVTAYIQRAISLRKA